MAADYGIDVHLDRVPQREEGMEPWEIMISESQERMVAIVAPDRLAEVEAVIDRWQLHRAVIGEVTETGRLRALWHGDEAGSIPARFLTDECPRYEVERAAAQRPAPRCRFPSCARPDDVLLDLLGSDALRSRAFVTRRYDQLVQSRTVRRPGLDAAVLRLRPVATAASRSRSTAPAASARSTRSPAARRPSSRPRGTSPAQAASRSASPTASTSATPRSPRSAGSWPRRSRAWRAHARRSALPIVSGNVSLYNDTDGRSIHPTPVVGCVGLVPDVRRIPGAVAARRCDPACLGGHPRAARVGAAGPLRHRLGLRRPSSISQAEASARPSRLRCSRRAAPSRTTSRAAASPSRLPRLRFTPASVRGSTSPRIR